MIVMFSKIALYKARASIKDNSICVMLRLYYLY